MVDDDNDLDLMLPDKKKKPRKVVFQDEGETQDREGQSVLSAVQKGPVGCICLCAIPGNC